MSQHFIVTCFFGVGNHGALQNLFRQRMHKVPRTPLRFHGHSDIGELIADMFRSEFIYKNCSFIYINSGFCIQLLVTKATANIQRSLFPWLRIAIEKLKYFHNLSVLERLGHEKIILVQVIYCSQILRLLSSVAGVLCIEDVRESWHLWELQQLHSTISMLSNGYCHVPCYTTSFFYHYPSYSERQN